MAPHNDNEYRSLVQSLMRLGWYRMRREPTFTGKQWRFRHGHTLDTPAREQWVVADSEIEALRIMWNLLCAQRVEQRLASH